MTAIAIPSFNIIVAQPRTVYGDKFPFFVEKKFGHSRYRIHGEVRCILRDAETGQIKSIHKSRNLVLDAGDLYYAELGVAATIPSNFTVAGTPFAFDGQLEMFKSVSVAPTKAANRSGMTSKANPTSGTTLKSMDGTYPKVNDLDADNSGKGADVLTYKVSYTAGDWSDAAALDDCDLTNPTPGATEAMLMWADGLAVTKSSSDTLVVYINHTFNGA
jgi:hypothetical protein